MATNIWEVFEVTQYFKSKQIPALIMTIDFEKCFDRIELSAIKGALQYFNFGKNYIKWVMLCLLNLNYAPKIMDTSEWFQPTRGVRQGCYQSPFLYLLCSEIMAHKIRENTSIKGIDIYDVMVLLSQFADNTTFFFKL